MEETGPAKPIWRRLVPQGWRSELTLLGAFAVLVGVVTSLGAYVFHWTIGNGLFGRASQAALRLATGQEWVLPASGPTPAWWGYALVLGLPVAGLLLAVGLVRWWARDEHSPGVAGLMEAVALRGGRIRVRPALARIAAAAGTIISGGSVGTVDPSVQIGATVGSWLGQRLRFSDRRVQTLLACGSAGGVAAAFNAPIAGVFFAQEIILGEFTTTAFGMVVISSVTASVITRVLRGESPAFRIPEYALRSPWEMFLYLALGVLAAGISAAYARGLLRIEALFQRWRVPGAIKALSGGLAVGAVGLVFPHLMGVGYETMDALLQGERFALTLLLALMLLKPVLTSITLGAGGSGGVFSPSLFIGSMLGGAFGQVVNRLFPNTTAPAPAYALVGMGAVLAGAVHCPVTAILLLFEMTRDYRIILPIMLCAAVSTLISQWLSPQSVYTERMVRRGIHIHSGRDLDVMEMITVEEAMGPDFDAVRPEMTLAELGQVFEESAHHGFPVVDDGGNLSGIVTLTDYRRALEEGWGDSVADICTDDPLTVFPDQNLNEALRLMAGRDIGRLPVVLREDPQRIVGLLRRYDVIRAYNQGLARRTEIQQRVQRMQVASYRKGALLTLDLPPEAAAVGHWIRDLNLPTGTIVVSLQRGERMLIPRGDTMLCAGDHVVVMVESAELGEKVQARLLEGQGLPRGRETRYGKYLLPAAAPAVGRRVVDLGLPRDSVVVSVKRSDRTMIAYGETVLRSGDQVVVFAEVEDLPVVEHCLLGGEGPPGPEYAFKNMLVLVDGSDDTWVALEQALELAASINATVHGLYVVEHGLPAESGAEPGGEAVDHRWGEQVLGELRRRCLLRNVDCIGTVQRGQLVEIVDQLDVAEDLIAVAYRGLSGEGGDLSALERVVRRTDLPVLVAIQQPREIRRLLALYDGGFESQQVLRLAGQMALAVSVPLDVLILCQGDEDAEVLLGQARETMARLRLKAAYHWRSGEAVEQVLGFAQERGSDLILAGVYRHGHLCRTLVGSTLDHLLRATVLPLLLWSRKDF